MREDLGLELDGECLGLFQISRRLLQLVFVTGHIMPNHIFEH